MIAVRHCHCDFRHPAGDNKSRYSDDRQYFPDSKAHGANIRPTWDPGGPHVGPMNLAIWELLSSSTTPQWYICSLYM